MFKRTFKVVFRPVKNNFVILPENYYKVVASYDTACLNLFYNAHSHYVSWAPHSGALKETEIGINARVAKEIGLNENDLVKCALITDVLTLKNVFVTPVSAKDWEIIELSSEKISSSVLEQTRIVNSNQILIIWINKSMQVALTVDRLRPIVTFGRIDHTTELVVSPNIYKGFTNGYDDGSNTKLLRSKTTAALSATSSSSSAEDSDASTATSGSSRSTASSASIASMSQKFQTNN